MEKADALLDIFRLQDWYVEDSQLQPPEGMQLEFHLDQARFGESPRVTIRHGDEDRRCRVLTRVLEFAETRKDGSTKTTYIRIQDISKIVLEPIQKRAGVAPGPSIMSARTGTMR